MFGFLIAAAALAAVGGTIAVATTRAPSSAAPPPKKSASPKKKTSDQASADANKKKRVNVKLPPAISAFRAVSLDRAALSPGLTVDLVSGPGGTPAGAVKRDAVVNGRWQGPPSAKLKGKARQFAKARENWLAAKAWLEGFGKGDPKAKADFLKAQAVYDKILRDPNFNAFKESDFVNIKGFTEDMGEKLGAGIGAIVGFVYSGGNVEAAIKGAKIGGGIGGIFDDGDTKKVSEQAVKIAEEGAKVVVKALPKDDPRRIAAEKLAREARAAFDAAKKIADEAKRQADAIEKAVADAAKAAADAKKAAGGG